MRSFILVLLLAIAGQSIAQTEKYSRVRIFADDVEFKHLLKLGVDLDHGIRKKGYSFESDFSARDITIIHSSGVKYEIMIDDVQEYYRQSERPVNRALPSCGAYTGNVTTPMGFNLGSMGGFYTYQEMLDQLDSMSTRFPNLISAKMAIDTVNSIEGRPLYFVRISDNAASNEAEPEMLYTALHHAREPAGMQQLIFYMYYLLENYSTSAEIQYLVNNTELYFIPCINPDGYIYNELTNPSGGGMWRKNRRDNNDGTYGIDLNRNYDYYWGYDDFGSSPNTSAQTYRGTSGFSEPETRAVRNFCLNHDFKVVINYHTYGNYLIHPWGYESIFTPDSATFSNFAIALTADNNYTHGTSVQTVGYAVNGSSDDWMYGEQTLKPKFLPFTPEAGHTDDGFWPPIGNIEDICKVNVSQNLTGAHILTKYAKAEDMSPAYLSSANGYLKYTIKRLGLDNSGSYTVSIIPLGSVFSSTGAPQTYSSLGFLQQATDSFSYSLSSPVSGQAVSFVLAVNNGSYSSYDTITKVFGAPAIAFNSTGTSMTGLSSSTWGVTSSDYYSSPSSIADSPFGNYPGGSVSILTLTNPVSLQNTVQASLSFFGKWEIESGWDFAQVQGSIDGGASWISLCGLYTKAGNMNQAPGEPLYDGFQTVWVEEKIDLNQFINQNLLIRFVMVSDNYLEYDGFYFDDLKISKLVQSPTGITEVDEQLELYPNPASQTISISSSNLISEIRLYDQLGKEILNTKERTLDVSDLAEGIYFCSVKTVDGNIVKKRISVIR